MVLMAICPVDGTPMPAFWPGTTRARLYCCQHCRSRGTTLLRLEREQAELDPVVVERLVAGRPAQSTQAERMAAAAALTRRGLSASTIALLIGVTPATAARYLRQLAEPQRVLSVTAARSRAEHLYAPVLARMTLVGWQVERSPA